MRLTTVGLFICAVSAQMMFHTSEIYYEEAKPTILEKYYTYEVPKYVTSDEEFEIEETWKPVVATSYTTHPEGLLVDPMVRNQTPTAMFEMAPCGHTPRGIVTYEGFPGQRNEVAWLIKEPAEDGNCTVRLNTGFEDDQQNYKALYPVDGKADVNGKFPCGRKGRNISE